MAVEVDGGQGCHRRVGQGSHDAWHRRKSNAAEKRMPSSTTVVKSHDTWSSWIRRVSCEVAEHVHPTRRWGNGASGCDWREDGPLAAAVEGHCACIVHVDKFPTKVWMECGVLLAVLTFTELTVVGPMRRHQELIEKCRSRADP